MKKISILLFLFICLATVAKSQILKPVVWSYAAKKTSANTATIFLKATIEDGWHLYSQFIKEGGPVKTTFTLTNGKGYALVGKVIEPKPITKYEDMFKMQIGYFEKSVVFQQKIKLSGKTAIVKGKVEFMVCNDTQCLPPDEVAFSVTVK
ncbi:protein-disulfide reductase DsbD N-terminal domain-containing protein [Pedobacter frigiditerrae]|uniref:protein-disulfide reductase DsbD N-terminal domain-containing protein n=1 Tax=Pedobacter frigiditerrae TaxID=2530452 RepID=UPI00292D9F90|nr:protein-disulfide reductase DsbD N-terminal domain-containing protein [Pedobacter frigiditerrae]